MELLQLKYFSHAAQTENFSHTAQHFMVPTPSVSVSIKKLEKEIGVKLFDRTANTVKLNEYGKILFKAVVNSERLLKMAKAEILDVSQTPFGEIKLLILTNRQKVTEAIAEFKAKYPQISFNIRHQWPEGLLNAGDYDIIVTNQIVSTELFEQSLWLSEEIFLAVHKDNPLSQKNDVAASVLQHEKMISMHKGSSLRECMDAFFEENKITPNIAIECDDPLYVRNYLTMGLGVTFFPAISWKDHISKDIRLLRVNDGLYRDSYVYVNRYASGMAHVFLQMLETKSEK